MLTDEGVSGTSLNYVVALVVGVAAIVGGGFFPDMTAWTRLMLIVWGAALVGTIATLVPSRIEVSAERVLLSWLPVIGPTQEWPRDSVRID
jgi:hypothetical protein